MKLLLNNFVSWDRPDGVNELLGLLDLYAVWDTARRCHVVHQKGDLQPPRYPWATREFIGGTQEEWSDFLKAITSVSWSACG